MSSSKTLTPPLDEAPSLKTDRPTGQLFELKELQKIELSGLAIHEAARVPPPPGPPPAAAPPPIPIPIPVPSHGGERGLRDFNYNGRDIKPRDSERSSGAIGRHRISAYSMYSTYSSYASSDDGRSVVTGRDRSGSNKSEGVPRVEHIERQPRRTPPMEAVPPSMRHSRRGGSGVVSQPPPTYAPSHDFYNRVRFADQERARRDETSNPGPRQIDMAHITGGHSANALWVFACCAFFWYRCLMDEDF
ncbi:uncharacterized protein CTRU02_202289 [Colletotrichum truncatum]|uniref:Uncharacterized protein n=1 Tax=Colletotrichum truncatum TaxID=5467 RepID=A0ACC3ZJV7_COLTU|nr:uncharacterized protein CTRU02_01449 [Colletotrichum truncatum]KAF6799770.1 hypothetical protein CTRU02_01449 [Colletotrichum truncatum]